MGISLGGLVSELDTKAIVDALMDVERIPRTLLAARSDDRKLVMSQLQSLNTALQALFTKAKDAGGPDALAQVRASTSNSAVTVTAAAGATPMSTRIVVDRIATSHAVVGAATTGYDGDPPVFTIENAAGELVEVRPTSGSPADVARALSAADAGITASAVAAGTVDGVTQYRLHITASASGADGVFRVYEGDAAAVTAGTAADLADAPGAAVTTTGEDARVRLWAGTAAEQVVTSSTNRFDELFPGIDLTVTAASTDPVTLTVEADTAARATAAGALIADVAAVLAGITKGSTATVGGAGETTTLGVFTGDSTVRALRGALTAAVQHPIDGVSPSSIGISVDRYGVLTFDEEVFTTALAADPEGTTAAFTGVMGRVEAVTAQYSDKYEGLLTSRIAGQEDEVDKIAKQLERWDVRLAQRRITLERTYTSMETMLGQLESQSAFLTSQLANLPTWSGSKK